MDPQTHRIDRGCADHSVSIVSHGSLGELWFVWPGIWLISLLSGAFVWCAHTSPSLTHTPSKKETSKKAPTLQRPGFWFTLQATNISRVLILSRLMNVKWCAAYLKFLLFDLILLFSVFLSKCVQISRLTDIKCFAVFCGAHVRLQLKWRLYIVLYLRGRL